MRRALDGNPPITTVHGQVGYGYFGKHAGYDYGIVKWPVKAPEAGVITAVYTNRENVDGGNIVELKGQYTHRFLHLLTIQVTVGQRVNEGDTLATTGNSGKVDYHLHHDVRKNGTAWTDSYANYYDWEQIIKGVNMPTIIDESLTDVLRIGHSEIGGWNYNEVHNGTHDSTFLKAWKGKPLEAFIREQWKNGSVFRSNRLSLIIQDTDNEYYRWRQLGWFIRGRELGRTEFRNAAVGLTWLRAMEILADDVEANKAHEAQNIGQLAIKDAWQGQIYNLQNELKISQSSATQLTKEVDDLQKKNTELQKQLDSMTNGNATIITRSGWSGLFDYLKQFFNKKG